MTAAIVRGFPELGRTRVMGIVNVTPDSFSDGGRHPDAVRHGLALVDQGADLLDVGGESTRPGADPVPAAEELRRVVPVVRALVAAGATVSVDTMKAAVAAAALDAGAAMVNDVSGALADPAMLPLVAARGVPCVLMHWREPGEHGHHAYDDVVADVCSALAERVGAALAAGVARDQLVIDPGLGFGKDGAQNWRLLAGQARLAELGPVLIGASRKRFLGALLASPAAAGATGGGGAPRPVDDRDDATAAVTALAALAGAWAVRVHDVPASADAVRVAAAVRAAR